MLPHFFGFPPNTGIVNRRQKRKFLLHGPNRTACTHSCLEDRRYSDLAWVRTFAALPSCAVLQRCSPVIVFLNKILIFSPFSHQMIPWQIGSPGFQISSWGTHLVHSFKEINLRSKGRERESYDGSAVFEIRVMVKQRRLTHWSLHKHHSPSSTTRTRMDPHRSTTRS